MELNRLCALPQDPCRQPQTRSKVNGVRQMLPASCWLCDAKVSMPDLTLQNIDSLNWTSLFFGTRLEAAISNRLTDLEGVCFGLR